jgi:uncharacterized protein YebE (UPF0316 family)
MIILICLKIFFARIIDVSLGTVRIYLTVKGEKIKAVVIAFFEVLIWFLIAKEAITTGMNSIWIPISYALGYATGTYIGIHINENVIAGIVNIQVVTKKTDNLLITSLREKGYAVSVIDLDDSADGIKRKMVIIQVKKRCLKNLINIIETLDKKYYYTISDIKYMQNGFLK